MRDWLDQLPQKDNVAKEAARAYQERIYGNVEHNVGYTPAGGEPVEVWTDGATPDYGAIGDAKLRVAEKSFQDPNSLSPSIRHVAVMKIDERLIKYGNVIKGDNPVQVLELTTNDRRAAEYLEERLRALGIPGYVRLEP